MQKPRHIPAVQLPEIRINVEPIIAFIKGLHAYAAKAEEEHEMSRPEKHPKRDDTTFYA